MAAAVAQALAMIEQGRVTSRAGKSVPVSAGSICLHGDQPGTLPFATAPRQSLAARAIEVRAPWAS